MKKILAVLLLVGASQFANSQVVKTVWASDFEYGGAPEPCSDTTNYRDTLTFPCSINTGCTTSHGKDWGVTSFRQFNGSYADSAQVNNKDTLWLTTCAFSTLADSFVTLEFMHICKVDFLDGCKVEVSNDSGATWHVLGNTEYINVKGSGKPLWNTTLGLSGAQYGYFSELSYAHIGNKWKSPNDSIPTNSWWEFEYFNASSFLGGVNSSANCMVRFAAVDGAPFSAGPANKYGWLLDSIRVKSAPCENIKPYAEYVSPQIYNGSLLYSMGPFQFYAKMYDDPVAYSGYKEAWLYYTVNGGPVDSVKYDSLCLTGGYCTALDSVYLATMPKLYNGVDSFKAGDTICYWTTVYDKSIPCRNAFSIPNGAITCNTFSLTNGMQLPYCDDFENLSTSNFWDTAMINGFTGWQLGNPSSGGGYNAHSGNRAWTTNLAGNYADQDEYYLYSPIFDFSTAVTPRISFWHRRNMPTNTSDGDRYRLEYSINNNTWLWIGGAWAFHPDGKLLNAPNCPSTWKDQTDGWSGQFNNNVWKEAFFQLSSSFSAQNQVQFRFVFKADNNALRGYGVSIDDWCIQNPPKRDVSVLEVVRPFNDYIKRAGETDSVWIKIRNIGTDTLTSIPLLFDIRNAGGVVTTISETLTYPHGVYPNGLPPLDIDSFIYSTKYTIPPYLYNIVAYPNLSQDADSSNDTARTVGHFGFLLDTISHQTDFDFDTAKWATTLIEPGTCGNPPPERPTLWERGTPNFGTTNNAYSSPNAWDINLDTNYDQNAFEVLYTNMFDMSNADSAFLSFWHNWNTQKGVDGYYIDYSFNRFNTFTRLTSVSQPVGKKINWIELYDPLAGNLGRGWNGLSQGWEYSQIPLNNSKFTGKSEVMFRFVFRSTSTTNTLDGVSIDDFRLVNPDLYDAEMFDIILPERGCVKAINEPVQIVVKNVGKDTLDAGSIPVSYRYRFSAGCTGTYGTWSSVKTDTISPYILPGLTYTHIFEDSVNMSVFGCYEFCVWTAHPNDKNQTNDTICGHVAENVRGCNIELKLTTGGSTTNPPDGHIIMQDSTTLDTLYLVPLTYIGPNVILWKDDICLNEKGGYKFTITSSDTTMIDYWRLRDPFGDSTVLIGQDPGSATFGWQCPPLLSASTDRIRLFGQAPLPLPQNYNIDVRSRNRGSVRLNYVWIETVITQKLPTISNGNIVYNSVDSFYYGVVGDPILFPRNNVLDSIWHAAPGKYEVCTWTFLPNGNADSATHDDTTCTDFVILDTVSGLPYCNNFDSIATQNPWGSMSKTSYDTTSSFKRGDPNQTHLSSARSGTNAWMTRLDSNYRLLDSSAIYSPEFLMDTSNCYNIEFYHKFKTEHAFDGGTVEMTYDSGLTWITVGGALDPVDTAYPWSTKNWFNTPYVTGLGGEPHPPGWTATSQNSFTQSYRDFKLPHVGQNPMKVVFRFRFGADASVESEGWMIDDFCLIDNGTCIYYSCTDGIQNGDEDDIDCGGIISNCDPCEDCFDGIWNQNEDSTDCGGVCKPCPSCVDNKRNWTEEWPDCGGDKCPPCGTCFDGIQTANWTVDSNGDTVKVWEDGVDCGGLCQPCWVGVDELDPNILFLGQTIPNPATDQTLIRYQLPFDGDVIVRVMNTMGSEMFRIDLNEQSGGIHQVEVDVSTWAQGLYYYSLEFNGERLIEKMVVEK